MLFDWKVLSEEEYSIAMEILGAEKQPDLVIAPDGNPYLYRWHIVRMQQASVYFHIQVASDPERPLHDHPFDNTSVILSGGYDEMCDFGWSADGRLQRPPTIHTIRRKPGDVIFRRAEEAHRLILPAFTERTLSLFSTGPKRRRWGFWYPEGWIDADRTANGVSIQTKAEM